MYDNRLFFRHISYWVKEVRYGLMIRANRVKTGQVIFIRYGTIGFLGIKGVLQEVQGACVFQGHFCFLTNI